MPIVKATDIAYVRLQSPDLDQAEEFLTNFGMRRAERTGDALYMRGTDSAHHLHVTHLGPARFVGLAFYVENEDDLKKAAKAPGASAIENIDEPGGGRRVRLTDPHGFQVEVLCGMRQLPALPTREYEVNWGSNKLNRVGKLMRLDPGPSEVKRLGHAVIKTNKLPEAIKWYRESLGFIASDEIYVENKENIVATFNRCDRGAIPVDHHVFLCMAGSVPGLNHVAYEVQSFDDVFLGHEHLKSMNKYQHVWGIGRHMLGSQVFDYWQDPWGRVHEHWTDSDMLTSETPPQRHAGGSGRPSQWGEPAPKSFLDHSSP